MQSETLPNTEQPDEPSDVVALATLLARAADRIERNRRLHFDYWPLALNLCTFKDGDPTDVLGALAVELGITHPSDLEVELLGGPRYNPVTRVHEANKPHPVIPVLLAHLKVAQISDFFAWSDKQTSATAATELRVLSAKLRIQAGAA